MNHPLLVPVLWICWIWIVSMHSYAADSPFTGRWVEEVIPDADNQQQLPMHVFC